MAAERHKHSCPEPEEELHIDLQEEERHKDCPAEEELHTKCCHRAAAAFHRDCCSSWEPGELPVANRKNSSRGPHIDFQTASRRDCCSHPMVAAPRTWDTVEVVPHREPPDNQQVVAPRAEPPSSLSQIDQKDST